MEDCEIDLVSLLSACVYMSEKAGAHIRTLTEQGFHKKIVNKNENFSILDNVNSSHPSDVLTVVDGAAQHLIISELQTRWPRLKIIGEEEVSSDILQNVEVIPDLDIRCPSNIRTVDISRLVMYIDPIDGTKEYCLENFENVTVLIGVTLDGTPHLGVIHEPFVADTNGILGKTTWGFVGCETTIKINNNIVSSPENNRLKLVTSSGHDESCDFRLLRNYDRILAAAAGHKMLMVANGIGDGYLSTTGRLYKWDICAGEAIIRALGGIVCDGEGQPLDYNSTQYGHRLNCTIIGLKWPDQLHRILHLTRTSFKTSNILLDIHNNAIKMEFLHEILSAFGSTEGLIGFYAPFENSLRGVHSDTCKIILRFLPHSKFESLNITALIFKRAHLASLPERSVLKFKKDMTSYQNEINFYTHYYTTFRSTFPNMPRNIYAESLYFTSEEKMMDSCFLIISDYLCDWQQYSILQTEHIVISLKFLAHFHAISYKKLFSVNTASKILHELGGFWDSKKRPSGELQSLPNHWRTICQRWGDRFPDTFQKDSVLNIGERLLALSGQLIQEFETPCPDNKTLIHGDFKTANIFFRKKKRSGELLVTVIDFQWTGVGFGVQDLMYFMMLSVPLSRENEYSFIRIYYESFCTHCKFGMGLEEFYKFYNRAFLHFALMWSVYTINRIPMDFNCNDINAGLFRRSSEQFIFMVEKLAELTS